MRVVAAAVGVVAVAAAVIAWSLTREHPDAGLVTVDVAGRSVQLPAGTTLGRALRELAVQPRAGRLLDVNGHVLRNGAFPGSIQLDGHGAGSGTTLRDGDRVAIVDGRDRKEALSRRVVRVRNGITSNPQYTVARAPGEEVVVRGAVSHELVSTSFRALGTAKAQRAVALTFDDGPWPVYTTLVLRTLERLHVHATFFVIGYLARAYPDLVRQEVRFGMAVGNHTYNHPEVPPFAELPRPLLDVEISLTADLLSKLGVHGGLFRPPAGSTSSEVEAAAAAFGDRVVLWSVDPADWTPGMTPKRIAARVLGAVRPGSIVVLHDGGGNRAATVAALPAIVHGIRKRGLKLVALGPSSPD